MKLKIPKFNTVTLLNIQMKFKTIIINEVLH